MSKPLYRQIADIFEKKIYTGELAVEDILPTEQALQDIYKVSRVTVRNALDLLEKQGLIDRIKGSGTYVKPNAARHDAFQLKGFDEDMASQGCTPGTKVIHFQLESAQPIIAEHLNIEVDTPIFSILRIKTIDEEPEILEQTYMPLALFPDLNVEVMQSSKYRYIEQQKGYQISLSRQKLKSILANKMVAKHLHIKVDSPVLCVSSIGELKDGLIFEYSIQYLRGRRYRFEYVARRGLE